MDSPWPTFSIAFLIALILIVAGKWSGHVLLAIVALILLGALFPPAGVLIGGITLLKLALEHPGIWSTGLNGTWGAVRSALGGNSPQQGTKQP